MGKILLKNIEKVYENNFKALNNINLEINDGEFMVLVGPSGSAKSTILRMIAGFEEITKGEIYIGDKMVNNLPPKDREIAMVFQNYALYPHMTVFENIAFPLKIAKVEKSIIKEKVVKVAKDLELDELLERKPDEISGGQRQRVAVARAIVRNPKVFLFDEPLSNLDAKLRVTMRFLISKLHKKLKEENKSSTMIYVTHDQIEAMTMGDRICILNKGEIMQIDTPLNVYNNPKNKFVASFIGTPSMNFIDGVLEKREDNYFLKLASGEMFKIPKSDIDLENYIGKKIYFGNRGEGIEVLNAPAEDTIISEVDFIENIGNEQIIYLKYDKFILNTKNRDMTRNFFIKDRVFIRFLESNFYLFDFETEERIN